MAKIIAVANQKGGVGKTTTSINLSASLAAAEKKTLLIDIDPQGNSTSGVGIHQNMYSIYEVLISQIDINAAIVPTEMPYLHLLPANINLVGAEVELINLQNREKILRQCINTIKSKYDFIIIDCPPSLTFLTLNSLTAADSILIPVQCEYFALEGLGSLLNTIHLVKQHHNKNLTIEGVLMTMFDSRLKLSTQVVEEVQRYFGEKVFKSIVHRNVRISEAPSHGKPIILYDATSTGSKNYIALASEIIENNKGN